MKNNEEILQSLHVYLAREQYDLARNYLTECFEERKSVPVELEHLKKQIEDDKKTISDLQELHRMQLAAISTASIQNTFESIGDRIDRTNEYWSQAYQDVCVAVDREIRWRINYKTIMNIFKDLKID